MIGVLGMALPYLVALITWSIPQSISITYYSLFAVGTFMVVLGSAGILLINYKGYSKVDDIFSTIAGVFGILICLFPMTYLPDPDIQTGILHLRSDISNIIHCVSAMVFFGTLAKTLNERHTDKVSNIAFLIIIVIFYLVPKLISSDNSFTSSLL